jgi:hypothetical protein
MVVVHQTEDSVKADPPPAIIQVVLSEFHDVFVEPTSLPPHMEYDHTILLVPGVVPVNTKPYRYSPLHKDEIEKQVKTLLQNGMIVPGTSSFASPVMLVHKKDGSWHFCVEYRHLNSITIKNKFSMPLIYEILDELAGSKFFSKLDFRVGFHHIRMAPEDEFKTAFKTHHEHYQFKVMPFGLSSAPATFQCNMNHILESFLRKSVIVFMDDIFVYSPPLQLHAIHLQHVLSLLRRHQFYVKLSKCEFAQQELEYLGHIIPREGVATDPRKTEAMKEWPVPTTTTELMGFLGLTGYYRKFVKDYSSIAKPLNNLLKKQFIWSGEAREAFEQLKVDMCSTPVLALPDFSQPFVVETNASNVGFSVVLMQKDIHVAFISKPLSVTHKSLNLWKRVLGSYFGSG